MPSRAFNAPAAVLHVAAGVPGTRRAVLTAAVRAACEHPPPAPVAYPTLETATQQVVLPLSDHLHRALRAVERSHFYGRTAWLCFYALVHRTERIEELLRLDAEALAQLDARVIALNLEVSTCPVPLTTRCPRSPKASPKNP